MKLKHINWLENIIYAFVAILHSHSWNFDKCITGADLFIYQTFRYLEIVQPTFKYMVKTRDTFCCCAGCGVFVFWVFFVRPILS